MIAVVVTFEHFENVKEVFVHETLTLPCTASPGTNVVWHYQQYCDNFEHGMYPCSRRTAVPIGDQYQMHTDGRGEHSLLSTDVTKNITGLYTCEDSKRHTIIYSVLLNIVCKYHFILLLGHLYSFIVVITAKKGVHRVKPFAAACSYL